MKITEYVIPLGYDGRRRTYHKRSGQTIIEFMTQYELLIKGKWYPVVRYDTAHSFAHKDVLTFSGTVTKYELPFTDYNVALTFAEKDLKENWLIYRENFLKEVN
jgi:hypothetical protein